MVFYQLVSAKVTPALPWWELERQAPPPQVARVSLQVMASNSSFIYLTSEEKAPILVEVVLVDNLPISFKTTLPNNN